MPFVQNSLAISIKKVLIWIYGFYFTVQRFCSLIAYRNVYRHMGQQRTWSCDPVQDETEHNCSDIFVPKVESC